MNGIIDPGWAFESELALLRPHYNAWRPEQFAGLCFCFATPTISKTHWSLVRPFNAPSSALLTRYTTRIGYLERSFSQSLSLPVFFPQRLDDHDDKLNLKSWNN